MMAIDILDKGIIKTHHIEDLDLLLKNRNSGFQKKDHTFTSEFCNILNHYKRELKSATKETHLPNNPDMDKEESFVEYVKRKAIEGDY